MYKLKISVIIPVYNVEKTVGNILKKLIFQNYQDIEIIAVNDGSKDDSWKILQKFAKKDKRIITVNQKNAGASAARNTGIRKATVDSHAALTHNNGIEVYGVENEFELLRAQDSGMIDVSGAL